MLARMKMGRGFHIEQAATHSTGHPSDGPLSPSWAHGTRFMTQLLKTATGSRLMQPAGSQFGQTSFFITAHILTTENLDSENVTPRGLGEDGF